MAADDTQDCQSIEQLLQLGGQVLQQAGIEAPRREARLLLQHALGCSAEQMLSFSRQDKVEAGRYLTLLARRARHEPFAYITGRKGFWTLELEVSPASLVPRADTETLITTVLEHVPDRQKALSVLDLGTGTGCILLAVLAEYINAWGVGIDINPQAAVLARGNAVQCGLGDRAHILAGRWSDALAANVRFDIVLSNPPYIPTGDLVGLMPEVREHEPCTALDGGADGLDAYRDLCGRLPALLNEGGLAFFEIGIGQAEALAALAQAGGLQVVAVVPDLAGISRVVVLRRVV